MFDFHKIMLLGPGVVVWNSFDILLIVPTHQTPGDIAHVHNNQGIERVLKEYCKVCVCSDEDICFYCSIFSPNTFIFFSMKVFSSGGHQRT